MIEDAPWERPAREVEVDITASLADIKVSPEIELVRVSVLVSGAPLGKIELPACDGRVPAGVLTDAVASDCAWSILGLFFERTAGLSREDLDRLGWTLFLREIWGKPDWPEAWFYEPPATPEPAPLRRVSRSWTAVEVSDPLPDLDGTGRELDVALTVGGVALGRVTVPVPIRAADLRARLTLAAGYELCRAAVREGLLGSPLAGPSLRERLAAAVARARAVSGPEVHLPRRIAFAPGWHRAVHRSLSGGAGWVIGRRTSGEIGSVASRRGMLPADGAVVAAQAAGGLVIEVPGPEPRRLVYAPDLLWAAPTARSSKQETAGEAAPYGRHHFEALFARGDDPWRYTTPYEGTKYEQTLELIPPGPIGRALEIGCAEGHFTEKLSARVGRLVAADIAEIALRRAAERCRACRNIEFLRLDLGRDPLPGRFGLIVCSETLYFLGSREALAAAARRMADALEPDGHLVMAHANVVADDADRPGFDWDVPYGARTIGETFALTPGLRFVRELRSPLYRVQLFRREEGFAAGSPEAGLVEGVLNAPPEPAVAEHILWNGGQPADRRAAESTTDRLPILLYHRVAPEGSPGTARYRVTPQAFEEQLRYLRDAGFRGAGLDEWAEAMAARRALPGRAVAFTFDDGYRDFLTWAWPALRRHGFTATVFLVAERIGGTNEWDASSGEELPLLGWEEIRRLQEEGVAFGSHGCRHRALPTLPNAEVARVLARSRRMLEEGLGTPVTALAYPWGLSDGAVRHFAAACGYLVGLDSKGGRSRLHGDPLNLPRIEVEGSDGLEAFVAKLGV